ncbi:sensor histidine kinase [Pedobacter insulae]|nr:HAMP domain-containing sensor histidine kinase [Pedobacter insulae]
MQKRIVSVLILMSICVLGITGLQLYWNYQNYQVVVANFRKDADIALDKAVDEEIKLRRKQIVLIFKGWLADSTIMKITCDTANREHQTAFTLKDAVPYYPNEKADQRTVSISNFKEKLGKITPKAKQVIINHFAMIVQDDLRDGTTFYYTQGIGHRLEKVFENSRLNIINLEALFEKELQKKNISQAFKLITKEHVKVAGFTTHKVNAALRRPYKKEMVWAKLETPNQYYFREMKWLIISSFLLIGITLFCFYYTIKTLFNQYKLVAIKNQFISNMTHEINTPLSSIQVTTEALQQFNFDEETKAKYLDIILYQTKKLNGLSEEILENAKLETLAFKRDQEVDIVQLLATLIQDLKLEERVILNYQSNLVNAILKGNKSHLSRSIANVLENAFKYNTAHSPTIDIELQETNKGFKITISDNGPGIANEFKDKIFDQFYRIPTGNVHDIKGYGLGLSYVKKIISQHHGSIRVSDNQPRGTIFSINLPKL